MAPRSLRCREFFHFIFDRVAATYLIYTILAASHAWPISLGSHARLTQYHRGGRKHGDAKVNRLDSSKSSQELISRAFWREQVDGKNMLMIHCNQTMILRLLMMNRKHISLRQEE